MAIIPSHPHGITRAHGPVGVNGAKRLNNTRIDPFEAMGRTSLRIIT